MLAAVQTTLNPKPKSAGLQAACILLIQLQQPQNLTSSGLQVMLAAKNRGTPTARNRRSYLQRDSSQQLRNIDTL